MTASDLVSIMTFANALEVKQDFTADRDLLTQTIRGFQIGSASVTVAVSAASLPSMSADAGAKDKLHGQLEAGLRSIAFPVVQLTEAFLDSRHFIHDLFKSVFAE